ncbi:MAG TPA: helix-turn-helix domain-containing protein [Acetobacteraceae bacterium]|nr:helix-turn-helix domain-containing protein [Acetobacteraceae bacterium]
MLATSSNGPRGGNRLPPGGIFIRADDESGAAARALQPLPAVIIQAARNSEIISQGGASGHCFLVVSGCVRTVRMLEDGRRQVGEFLLPGDVLGWEAPGGQEFAAEAVTDAVLRRFSLRAIEERADANPAFAQGLRRYAAGQFRNMRGRLVMLGRMTACERIAAFLLEMSERLRCLGRAIDLPMGRADMADYLGLTIETVSRGLGELRLRGAISIEQRRIIIRDRGALRLASSGRLH